MMSLLWKKDFHQPYSSFEAWAYDHLIAKAVLDQMEAPESVGLSRMLGQVPPGGRALDVGCGGGQLAIRMAERRPDLRCLGVDLSAEQIQRARRRARHLSADRVEFRVGDVGALPLEDESVDLVVSIASLKHWSNRRKGLTECLRVLKGGGLLIVVELDRGCTLEDACRFVDLWAGAFYLPTMFLTMAFRTFVAGQSLDLDEARQLTVDLEPAEWSVERTAGMPTLLLRALKPPS